MVEIKPMKNDPRQRILVPFASMSVLHAAGMLLRIFVGRPTKFGKPFRLLTFGLDPMPSHLEVGFSLPS
jgi:hypothetical protein